MSSSSPASSSSPGATFGGDAVVVSCALTGVLANRRQCPAIPYTPAEIGEEALRVWNAGATVVHIHGREDDGSPTWRKDVFAAIKQEVSSRCPIIINFSTGNLDDDISAQEAILRDVRPDVAALNMGTMNYMKYSARRKDFVFDMIFPNPLSKIRRYLEIMNEAGVHPELECFDSGHTATIAPLLDMGLLQAPVEISFIMGVLGGLPTSVQALQLQASQVPAGSSWQVIGIGRDQWRIIATALVLGGNIRVGLEDNFYLPDGAMAQSNGELVERAVRLTGDIGRRPATLEETRAMLGLSA
ncbi:MAG: 3-keto-5-aminohexanoate cleavage protein [Alphaproteobacteria bacterium]|nr:3-keto-5-aminohexanoate cleavage protein [Alphaproteobacteria bacterium]